MSDVIHIYQAGSYDVVDESGNVTRLHIIPTTQEPEPKSNKVDYGFQVVDPEERKEVQEALTALWKALHLSSGGRIFHERWRAHMDAYDSIGELLLGEDYPQFEIKC